jgi:hypothetical protein
MAGLVGLRAPADVSTAAVDARRPSLRARYALALSAHRVQSGVGAADEMEPVAHDPGVRQRCPDRLAVGVGGIDRDDLDPSPNLRRQSEKPALDDLPAASGKHLDRQRVDESPLTVVRRTRPAIPIAGVHTWSLGPAIAAALMPTTAAGVRLGGSEPDEPSCDGRDFCGFARAFFRFAEEAMRLPDACN